MLFGPAEDVQVAEGREHLLQRGLGLMEGLAVVWLPVGAKVAAADALQQVVRLLRRFGEGAGVEFQRDMATGGCGEIAEGDEVGDDTIEKRGSCCGLEIGRAFGPYAQQGCTKPRGTGQTGDELVAGAASAGPRVSAVARDVETSRKAKARRSGGSIEVAPAGRVCGPPIRYRQRRRLGRN